MMKSQIYPVLMALLAWLSGGCANTGGGNAAPERSVHVIVAALSERHTEIRSFGSLVYGCKLDITAPQDARVAALSLREGDTVRSGGLVGVLDNAQISLAVGVARNAVAQAQAAVRLAEARLVEGAQAVEARIMGLEKAGLELEQARRELAERVRKQADQETLRDAGGVNEESIRAGRFDIESGRQRIELLQKEIEMQRIGLRDDDIIGAGMVPASEPQARRNQLVRLTVRGLEAERDGAVARLDAARKELDSASWSLSELRVLSPMDGVIGARYVEPGQRVKRDEALYTVVDADSLFAVVPVPEAEAPTLARGMKATIRVDAVDRTYEGVVDLVSPLADARSASCTVRVALSDGEHLLRPGMFARVSIRSASTDRVIVVPSSALTEVEGDAGMLFVVVNQSLVERRVRLGEPTDDGWIVSQGLDAGDVVVDAPDGHSKAGEHVSIALP